MDIRVGRVGGRSVALLVVSVALAGLLVPSRRADAAGTECPDAYPVSDLVRGQSATGWTVSEGTAPEPFAVEILGVMENAIAPGKDLIVVDTQSSAIDEAGGIWAGMSGSPIYIGGDLVGAVAYGFSFGASSIAGVTPAQDMLDILSYPSTAGSTARPASRVEVERPMARTIARREGVSLESASSFKRLAVPLSVSGVDASRYEILNDAMKRAKTPFFLTPGGTAAAAPVTETLVAGDSLAGAYSLGDITYAGVGTATLVCEGQIIGFGHPFSFTGETLLGAAGADVLAVIDDQVYGPYKLTNVKGIAGIVDQDRLSGIRVDATTGPPLIPIDSLTEVAALGSSRTGLTQAVTSEFLAFIAGTHLFTSIDAVFDEIGEGNSSLTWTVTGLREGGVPFEFTRSNQFASRWDISIDSIWEMMYFLDLIYGNDLEDIEFTGLDLDVDVTPDFMRYRIKELLFSYDGVKYVKRRRVALGPNQTFYVRANLEPADGGATVPVDLTLSTPERFRRDGLIEVAGAGANFGEFCFGGDCGDAQGASLDDVLTGLAETPTNNTLVAEFRTGRRYRVKSEDLSVLDQVVAGRKRIWVLPAGVVVFGSAGSGKTY